MNSNQLIDKLEAVVTLLRSEQRNLASHHNLQQVHLQILNYLSRCNRYSDSLLTLCEYLNQTKGTISQSVSLLEKMAYLEKCPDPHDKRKVHLKLSPLGYQMATMVPGSWEKGLALLSGSEQKEIEISLTTLLRRIQEANQFKAFGVCKSCKYLRSDTESHSCGLTGEKLDTSELEQICVHYQ